MNAAQATPQTLLLRRDGGVLHVTLNRPEARNAMSLAMVLRTARRRWPRPRPTAARAWSCCAAPAGISAPAPTCATWPGARMTLADGPATALVKVNAAPSATCAWPTPAPGWPRWRCSKARSWVAASAWPAWPTWPSPARAPCSACRRPRSAWCRRRSRPSWSSGWAMPRPSGWPSPAAGSMRRRRSTLRLVHEVHAAGALTTRWRAVLGRDPAMRARRGGRDQGAAGAGALQHAGSMVHRRRRGVLAGRAGPGGHRGHDRLPAKAQGELGAAVSSSRGRDVRKILVANRGEIACRVMRTAHRAGLPHGGGVQRRRRRRAACARRPTRRCTSARRRRPSPTCASTRCSTRRAAAAPTRCTPATASCRERADFAQACADAGLVFIGPPPAAITRDGRQGRWPSAACSRPACPARPATWARTRTTTRWPPRPQRLGLPLLVKAVAGGGGRGMRLVRDLDELPAALAGARREAQSAFGDGRLMLERLIDGGRHIEIQVFADAHGNAMHLGERDCTAQRRRQKVIEEAPSPGGQPGDARGHGSRCGGRGAGRGLPRRRHGGVHRRCAT